jgi:hypothetical protein
MGLTWLGVNIWILEQPEQGHAMGDDPRWGSFMRSVNRVQKLINNS